jgi:hypothetical protein
MSLRISLRAIGIGLAATLIGALMMPIVRVDALSSSSLLLSDPRTTQTSTYTFSSSGYTTGTTVRCIDLVLNDQADGAGSAVGTTTSFTLDSSSVITAGSWTEDTAVNGRLRITNGTGETPNASGNIVFGAITNGGTEGATYYGLFTSYTDVACTGGNEVDTAVVAFTYKDGELVQLTIDPTLTFTCSSVPALDPVNGTSTTVASTPSGINHGNAVTFTTNGVSAHDLNVTTNATGGYTVYVRQTGDLSNGTDTIANWTGTNAVPTTFPAPGTEAWGYTSSDATLTGGTADRFTTGGGDVWAGFSTSNEPVMDNTTATSGTDTVRVGHQVGVASTTPAGTYQTTIVYTVASVY